MSAHLGSLVSALVDDQLPLAEREKALAHAACCAQCTAEIQATRAARGFLNTSAYEPQPRTDFMSHLVGIAAEQGQNSNEHNPVSFDSAEAQRAFIDRQSVPKCAFSGHLTQRVQWGRWAKYTAVFALGGVCTAAFMMGARPQITPSLDDDFVQAKLEGLDANPSFLPLYEVASHDASSPVDSAKLTSWLKDHDWTTPMNLPEDVKVEQVGFSTATPSQLDIVLSTAAGRVLVTETKGALDEGVLSEAHTLTISGDPMYVVSENPTHLIWQSKDTVIELTSHASITETLEVARSFSVDRYDEGLSARFVRGFSDLAGVVSE
ncbi:hypothetical protein [Timonella sp. A28]|uniref:hypothetical protein n=1 Tax=Timonella sp. A28 TaxID=3442640 RepID=UPI003EBED2F7